MQYKDSHYWYKSLLVKNNEWWNKRQSQGITENSSAERGRNRKCTGQERRCEMNPSSQSQLWPAVLWEIHSAGWAQGACSLSKQTQEDPESSAVTYPNSLNLPTDLSPTSSGYANSYFWLHTFISENCWQKVLYSYKFTYKTYSIQYTLPIVHSIYYCANIL